MPQMANWSLHYWGWMIGDGEPHRHVGEVFEWFAIDFWAEEPLTITPLRTRSATPCGDYQYTVTGEVIFILEKKAVVIDFGLLAIGYIDNLQQGICAGDVVTGKIGIGLPLCIEPIPHELIGKMGHQFQIEGISADLTPYRNHRRDPEQISYREVASTEETKAADYVLHCKELGPSTMPYPPS